MDGNSVYDEVSWRSLPPISPRCQDYSTQTVEIQRYQDPSNTTNEVGDDFPMPTVPPTLDLQKIYSSAEVRRRGKTQSMSSFTTEWSATTIETSNTTSKREDKMQQKRRFLLFTKVLMRLLERKDPDVFHEAQVVIHECEEKKRNGESESLVESLRSPLKEAVGPGYWNEARAYSKRVLNCKKMAPKQAAEEEVLLFNMSDLNVLSGYSSPDADFLETKKPIAKEKQIRKKRLWMIICVVMKHLMKKDPELYLRAKDLVEQCVSRHRRGEEGYSSLTGSIQSCLKQQIGITYWKLAESFVAKFLLSNPVQCTPSQDLIPREEFSYHSVPFRKRMDETSSLKGDQKRRCLYEE